MLQKSRSLDGSAAPGSQGIDRLIGGGLFAGSGIDRDHFDSGPEGPKKQPYVVAGIDDHVRIDTIVIVGGPALDHDALVRPFIVGRRRVKRGVAGHPNDRVVGAEGRAGVINPVKPVVIADAGSPNIGDRGAQGRVHPCRNSRKDVADGFPINLVGGLADLQKVIGAKQAINATVILEDCWVVSAGQRLATHGARTDARDHQD